MNCRMLAPALDSFIILFPNQENQGKRPNQSLLKSYTLRTPQDRDNPVGIYEE